MINQIIKEKIQNLALTNGAKAVYLVGINDGLVLSDYDLIVVSEEINSSIKKQWRSLDPNIDLRRIVSPLDFKAQHIYWPHANYELIFGQDLREDVPLEEKKKLDLIKLAGLFFTSFLRNYYRLLDSKDQAEILRNLNDWCYVELFMPEVTPEFQNLISNIKKARTNYPHNSSAELKALLTEAIDESWKLIKIIDTKLKIQFGAIKKINLSVFREVTIFKPSDEITCRNLSEKYLSSVKRLKIIFLPIGFKFIHSSDELVKSFIKFNVFPRFFSLKFCLKRLIKIIVGLSLLGVTKNKYATKLSS